MATGPFYDTMPGPLRRDTLNEMWGVWQEAIGSTIKGDAGWSPLIRSVQDGDRVVLEVYDWGGGQGAKPIQTGFLGSTGFVPTAALAIDVRGPIGFRGDAATISVGTVTTTAPGTTATVLNSGTSSNAVFNFEIPRGATGLKGDAATISVGTVTTGAAGTSAGVTNSGTQNAATLNFTIPRGDKGEQGIQGVKGDTGEKGDKGDTGEQGLQGIQGLKGDTGEQGLKGDKGDTGTAATISVGTVTTGAPGTSVVVTNSGTTEAAVFNFTIPRGADGSGAGDMLKSEYDSVGDGVVNASRSTPWTGITDKPLVIAAGADAASARLVIDAVSTTELAAGLDTKVDKVTGKGLSTEDFTTAEKTKLSGISEGATANQTDAFLLDRANHTGSQAISTVTGLQDALDSKQETLVSGTNIKTVNGESILGSGNLVVSAGGGGGPTLQGDTAPYTLQTKTYQITNYNSFSSYAVSASAGTASIEGDTITFTAPASAGNVSLTLTVDGQPTVFTIVVLKVVYIPVPTPTPANFGDPLEGGFYAGMIWNELAQSATSTTIGTGSKTFTVPAMEVVPIVYEGQQLEVRSRANPANKMVGNVTGVVGTSLTINVTSIGGSGTFSDWSVMARHRVIVAPKASGEHAGIALKNANSALPTACQTLTEGFAATQAMRDADTSTVYPAAHWARNLNIGGRADWYIPARDELELCWRNLKPTTTANYVAADRPTAASFSYANNGSYGDTANTHGTNNNSSPTGAAYTSSVPGQTAATAFRSGGAEAFEFGSTYYWSSSDYNATGAWSQYWFSSNPGFQSYGGKASTGRVRAVRRSII